MSVEKENSEQGSRKKIMILGSVLWAMAIVMLVIVWMNSNTPPAEENGNDVTTLGSEDDAELGDGKPKKIVVNMFPFELMDFSLTERNGETVTKEDLLGKPWAVSFIFTRCAGPCTMITTQMAKLQKQLEEEDIRLVTITVDPKNDTPEVLQKYADAFQADENRWLFLTGDQDKVYELISLGFKQVVHEETGDNVQKGFEIAHSSNIMHVSAEGVVMGKYNGQIDSDMVKLRKALVEEAESLEKPKTNQEELSRN